MNNSDFHELDKTLLIYQKSMICMMETWSLPKQDSAVI